MPNWVATEVTFKGNDEDHGPSKNAVVFPDGL